MDNIFHFVDSCAACIIYVLDYYKYVYKFAVSGRSREPVGQRMTHRRTVSNALK